MFWTTLQNNTFTINSQKTINCENEIISDNIMAFKIRNNTLNTNKYAAQKHKCAYKLPK